MIKLNRKWHEELSENLEKESKDYALSIYEGQCPWMTIQKAYVAGVVSQDLKIKEIFKELENIKDQINDSEISTKINSLLESYTFENLKAIVK